jgi:hypothetical protein
MVEYGTVYGTVPSWHCQCKNGIEAKLASFSNALACKPAQQALPAQKQIRSRQFPTCPSVFQYPVDSKFSLQNMLLTLQDSVAWTIYTMFLRARFATDATASTSRQADKKAQLYEVSTLALCSC